jgi:hypothetical protein
VVNTYIEGRTYCYDILIGDFSDKKHITICTHIQIRDDKIIVTDPYKSYLGSFLSHKPIDEYATNREKVQDSIWIHKKIISKIFTYEVVFEEDWH